MSFRKDIESGLEQIQQMQEQYRLVRDMEILPISFFSTSYDILKSLAERLHEMEAMQLATMQEHLSFHEQLIKESALLIKRTEKNNLEEFVQLDPFMEEKKKTDVVEGPFVEKEKEKMDKHISEEERVDPEFFGDIIRKQPVSDLRKALSLNDQFHFQKNLFVGDINIMNETLDRLNGFASLGEAMAFLNNRFQWNWDEGSALEFKEILERRFS